MQWWTGWNKTTVRLALSGLPVEEVNLHGETGIALADDDPGGRATDSRVATLLPALDPTPMGWKRRDWLFGISQHHVFDNRGNIGPSLWWDGEVIGSWAVTPAGEIRTAVVADRGAAARAAVQDAAALLHARLHGAVIIPAVRTPLELARAGHHTPTYLATRDTGGQVYRGGQGQHHADQRRELPDGQRVAHAFCAKVVEEFAEGRHPTPVPGS